MARTTPFPGKLKYPPPPENFSGYAHASLLYQKSVIICLQDIIASYTNIPTGRQLVTLNCIN